MLTSTVLIDADDVAVVDATCTAPAGDGSEEPVDELHIILPRRGVFVRHTASGTVTADAATALLGLPGEIQIIDHPVHGGDRSTVIIMRGSAWRDATPSVPNGWTAGSRVLTVHRSLVDDIESGTLDPFGAEAYAVLLLDLIATRTAAFDSRMAEATLARHRSLVDDTRQLLASDYAFPWRLADVGRAIGSSPFQLARVFRRHTGSSIHDYLVSVRLAEAAERLRRGENDIAALAVACGFTDHSHFTKTFHRRVGVAPSAFRNGR